MLAFLTLLLICVFTFAVMNYIIPYKDNAGKNESFYKHLGNQYQIVYGENPDPNNTLQWVIYTSFTLFINVLVLNLLISIIGATFEKVTEI